MKDKDGCDTCKCKTILNVVFDKSKNCGPVCAIYCQYGNVLDSNGCKTCACKR